MNKLLEQIIREAIKDFLSRNFTLQNLKALRDVIRGKLKELTGSTETKLDDWVVIALDYILTDDALVKIYDFVLDTFASLSLCKANPYNYTVLAQRILSDDEEGMKCGAAVSVSALLMIIEILVPELINWYKTQANTQTNAQ